MEMKKDNRSEFEKMEAGEMFWNSDEKIGELKKHARRLADRFNATTEDEPELRLSTTIYLWLISLTASKELSILLLKLLQCWSNRYIGLLSWTSRP